MTANEIVNKQREYFKTGETRSKEFRRNALIKLKQGIKANEDRIYEALKKDLNKSPSETYMCEIGLVYDEINFHLKHIGKWMKAKRVKTPVAQFRSKSFVSPEPYGVVLIMAPWNYPLQLCLSPLVGAISAGNCAVIKPSAYAKETSGVINKIISESFDEKYIAVIEGGREENSALLNERFDYIFFTGSVSVGKLVMEAASKNLTPVSLELGGKSPVIVDDTANIEIAARRIAFGKVINAGQTCVAPDYLFVKKSIKNDFVLAYKKALSEFFPNGDMTDYPKIVNGKHYNRLLGLMKGENAVIGGNTNDETRYIEPTLLDGITFDSPIMQEEVFGPILPMIEYEDIKDCVKLIQSCPKPLALYLFTKSKQTEKFILDNCSFGGGCINDTVIHLATPYMPFGGVGESGMGSYHGKQSFDTFSHNRSIVKKAYSPDLSMRYHPYSAKNDALIKKFMK